MDSIELRPTTDILTDELESIKSELNKTNCNVEEIKNKVNHLILEDRRKKQLEQVERFRKHPDNTLNKSWMLELK